MSKKEIERLIEWLTLRGKKREEIMECIFYINTGKLPEGSNK